MRTTREKGHAFEIFFDKLSAGMHGELQNISLLLKGWSDGDQQALEELVSIVYPEIRKIARQRLGRRGSPPTLESAALANEAYLRLIRARGIHCENRLNFFALCAQVIRRIIGEYARSHRYAKRGGSAVRVPLDEEALGTPAYDVELLALDEALESLSNFDPRKARLVEMHCFGGLTVDETAQVLDISTETAKRDWKLAKAWLRVHLAGKASPSG